MKNLIVAIIIGLFSFSAFANFGFENIGEDDLKGVVKELSGNFKHTTVTGAGAEGNIFGFQVGILTGTYSSPMVSARAVESGEPVLDSIVHAGLVGVLSIPMGLTFETNILPSQPSAGAKNSVYSFGAKWTFMTLPLDLATRLSYTSANLSLNQPIGSAHVDTQFKSTITALDLIIGKNFIFIEPYAGLSYAMASGEMSFTGSTTVFDSSLTSGQSATASQTSFDFFGGVELHLGLMALGLEYGNVFGNSKITGKLAFGF